MSIYPKDLMSDAKITKRSFVSGLPLFMVPNIYESKKENRETINKNRLNNVNYSNRILSAGRSGGRKLVFFGKYIKRAGDKTPFSIFNLMEQQKAGIIDESAYISSKKNI